MGVGPGTASLELSVKRETHVEGGLALLVTPSTYSTAFSHVSELGLTGPRRTEQIPGMRMAQIFWWAVCVCTCVCAHVCVHVHVGLPRTLSLPLQVLCNSVFWMLFLERPPGPRWRRHRLNLTRKRNSAPIFGEYWAPEAPSSTTSIQQAPRRPEWGCRFCNPLPQRGW